MLQCMGKLRGMQFPAFCKSTLPDDPEALRKPDAFQLTAVFKGTRTDLGNALGKADAFQVSAVGKSPLAYYPHSVGNDSALCAARILYQYSP